MPQYANRRKASGGAPSQMAGIAVETLVVSSDANLAAARTKTVFRGPNKKLARCVARRHCGDLWTKRPMRCTAGPSGRRRSR